MEQRIVSLEEAYGANEGEKTFTRETKTKWSGKEQPPAIGSMVNVRTNDIGPSIVTGYCLHGDWLEILVIPQNPPEFVIRQKGYNTQLLVTGVEFDALSGYEHKGPTVEQLQALQTYAKANGRNWKSKLSEDWNHGRDTTRPQGNLLRQVRNQFGPRWLYSKQNKVVPLRN